jgi:rhodanese-related sulfurtransferase
MVKSITKRASALAISLLAGLSTSCTQMRNPLQDTQKAAHYFEDELNFKTNPYGAKLASEGKAKNVVIVDVRRTADFAKGHIPGSINIPFDQYDSFEGAETEFPGLRKDGHNYIYCYELLCNLSQKASRKFASLGYPVKEISGGFKAWVDHSYPIEASK